MATGRIVQILLTISAQRNTDNRITQQITAAHASNYCSVSVEQSLLVGVQMDVIDTIRESEALIQWIDSKIDGLEIPNPERCRLAAGCLDMAMEHWKAIVQLTAKELYGSAASLLRAEFEAYVRGVWLLFCASDTQIEQFKEDKLERKFGDLIDDIEKLEAYDVGTLSYIKERSWAHMNSLLHSGFSQVVRRNTDQEIRPIYTDTEIQGALTSATSFGILASVEIANMAKDEKLTMEFVEHGNAYFANSS